MELYKNISGNSGVIAYEIGPDYIRIKFQDGKIYNYDYLVPGKTHVEEMKNRAIKGRGLTTYINKFVRENYSGKDDPR